MWRAAAVLLGGFLALPAAASAASFDCVEAKAPVEHLICNDPVLSALDERLAEAYAPQKATARDSQRTWLRQRLEACAIPPRGELSDREAWRAAPCLVAQYRQRLADLGAVVSEGPEPTEDGAPIHPLCLSAGLGFGDQASFSAEDLRACDAGMAHIPVEPGRMGGWEATGLSYGFPTWTAIRSLETLPDGRESWLVTFNTGGTGVFTSIVATGPEGEQVLVPGGDRCIGGISDARLEGRNWEVRFNAVGPDIAKAIGLPETAGADLPYCSICCAGEVQARFPLDGGPEEITAVLPPEAPLREDASVAERCLAEALGEGPVPATEFTAARDRFAACMAR